MVIDTNPGLRQVLADRKAAVAAAWFAAMVRTSFIALAPETLHRRLSALTERAIDALLLEPFPHEQARAVGAELARLRYAHPSVLGETLDVLLREIASGLPLEDLVALRPSLASLLGGMAAGFAEEQRAAVLADQQVVHQALLASHRAAEEALQASEERYRAVVTQVEEGIVLSDAATGRIVEINPAFGRLLGYAAEELVGLPLHRIVAHRRDSVQRNIDETLRKGRHQLNERRCRRKDGGTVTVESSITAIETGQSTLLCGVVRDITERRRAEAELCAARAALAESREAERLRLAQELHDGALQELLGLRFQLVAGAEQLAGGGPTADMLATARQVEQRIADVAAQLRELIGGLRPPGIDEVGLGGALENCVGSLAGDGLPAVRLAVPKEARSLPRTTSICLFRVAQEAIRNTVEHTGAGHIDVRLRLWTSGVSLRVADNGSGFDVPEPLDALAKQGHFGLAGMAERVESAQGRLRVRSRLGRGTVVTAWLPLGRGDTGWENEYGDDPGSGR